MFAFNFLTATKVPPRAVVPASNSRPVAASNISGAVKKPNENNTTSGVTNQQIEELSSQV